MLIGNTAVVPRAAATAEVTKGRTLTNGLQFSGSSWLLQIAFEIDSLRIEFLIGDRFGVKPLDDDVLDGIGKEMVPMRIVVADEVLLHIVRIRQIIVFEIAEMHHIHVEARGFLPG